MNVIDHAILIPASPTFIWRFLGDISLNAQWQDDCTNLSFLTTQREGRGTRWRYTTPKGKDVVIEITAWYDTLGYEYIVVDGSSVGENKGRIRLQEIAEGTLVQWTFNYELDGMLSSLRNSMGLKRSLTNNIQDSLRNLYKYVQNETGGISTHEAKALLKEAPDVEERSSYQPRHPSNFKEDTDAADDNFAEPDYPSEKPIAYNYLTEPLYEPPVTDDDTKPNPVVQGTEEIPVVDNVQESNLIQGIDAPPVEVDDTKPNAPIIEPVIESTPEPETFMEEPQESIVESTPAIEETLPPIPQSDIRDTSTVSVFELFGLQKPSETQEMAALSDKDLEQANIEPVVPTPPTPDIIASQVDTPAEPEGESISTLEIDVPIDTGSIVEVEAKETIETSAIADSATNVEAKETVETSSILDREASGEAKETVEIAAKVLDEPSNEVSESALEVEAHTQAIIGLRASLRQKLAQLRTRQ